MNTLDAIIKQTRKFTNKKNVKLDKNSIIEHAIGYIRELQQMNEMYAKRLEEASNQIRGLQRMVMMLNSTVSAPSFTPRNGPLQTHVPYGTDGLSSGSVLLAGMLYG